MLLEKLTDPKELKNLSYDQMSTLSDEIRSRIIQVLSANGGHLSSNLGIVELTIAMHVAFSSPDDKFIFDVSHQTYTHKLLTGRNARFSTLRQFNGLSGFSNPSESIHDHFHMGHAGSALSIALGLCKSRDLTGNDFHVIPVIGDASLTCGLTLEALNNIDDSIKKFVVILNDNKMAISENVGNIKNILSRLLNSPRANKLYHDMQKYLSKVPSFGDTLAKQGKKVTESLKNLVSPAPFFEQQNLTYIGPIDGHNIKKLVETFEAIKNHSSPVIVHVMTTKGKGMAKAILNPTSYHGVKPFNPITGDFLSTGSLTFPKAFGKHLHEMASKDPNIVVINPAMLKGSSLMQFKKDFPHCCIDVGIAEGHAVTLAGGIAKNKNVKTLISIYSSFLQRAFDNIFHDVCLQNSPCVFAIDRSGLSGPDGATHHGIYDIGFLKAMPNMIITQPRNASILKELLNSAFLWKKPVAIRYPNRETIEDKDNLEIRQLNSYDILNSGSEILIIAIGHMYNLAFEIKAILNQHGYNPTIVDPIFIKPLNENLFKLLFKNHNTVITIEEHSITCGFGSIFNSFIVANNLKIKTLNFGLPDEFLPHGKTSDILKRYGLCAESISQKILNSLENSCKNNF